MALLNTLKNYVTKNKKHQKSKDVIKDIMAKVAKDTNGTLASRMMAAMVPFAPLREAPPKKKHQPWAGDKIKKALIQGRCAGTHVEGVIGGALREMVREKNLAKI